MWDGLFAGLRKRSDVEMIDMRYTDEETVYISNKFYSNVRGATNYQGGNTFYKAAEAERPV